MSSRIGAVRRALAMEIDIQTNTKGAPITPKKKKKRQCRAFSLSRKKQSTPHRGRRGLLRPHICPFVNHRIRRGKANKAEGPHARQGAHAVPVVFSPVSGPLAARIKKSQDERADDWITEFLLCSHLAPSGLRRRQFPAPHASTTRFLPPARQHPAKREKTRGGNLLATHNGTRGQYGHLFSFVAF